MIDRKQYIEWQKQATIGQALRRFRINRNGEDWELFVEFLNDFRMNLLDVFSGTEDVDGQQRICGEIAAFGRLPDEIENAIREGENALRQLSEAGKQQ